MVLDIARPSVIDLMDAHHPLSFSRVLAARPSDLNFDAAAGPFGGAICGKACCTALSGRRLAASKVGGYAEDHPAATAI
jgi:hypothetical protein